MALEIRKCHSNDVEALKVITRRWFFGDRYIDEGWNNFDVMLRDGIIVGYADCRNNVIDGIVIDFNLHRQGLGTTLLTYCEQKLFEHHNELVLECFEESLQANNFYKKNGWKEVRHFLDEGNTGMKKVAYKKAKLCRS